MKTTGFPITLLCAARSLAGPISWINELSPLRDELVDLPVHLPKDRFENEDIRYSSVAPTSSEDYQYSSFGGSFEHLPEAWFESRYSSVVPTSPEDYQYSSFGGSFEQPLDHYLQTSSEESNAEPEVLQQKSHLPGSSRLRDTKLLVLPRYLFQCLLQYLHCSFSTTLHVRIGAMLLLIALIYPRRMRSYELERSMRLRLAYCYLYVYPLRVSLSMFEYSRSDEHQAYTERSQACACA